MLRSGHSIRHQTRYRPLQRRSRGSFYSYFRAVLSFALLLVAAALLFLSKSDNQVLALWRGRLQDLTMPLLDVTNVPAGYVQRSIERLGGFYRTHEEMNRLRQENDRLRAIRWGIEELEQKNSRLKALLNSVDDPRHEFITGQIVSAGSSLFGSNAVVNLGRRNGVNDGYAVINADGLIGRTRDTSDGASRVLLLTDKTSRIPVFIGKDALKAVAIGDGGEQPLIDFLPPDAAVYEGDIVFTSGHGGDLPGGLPIGTIRKVGSELRVATRARLEGNEYVSVLLFEHKGFARGP